MSVVSVEIDVPPKPICNKLRHGTCPHGITGKRLFKGVQCNAHHPKLCYKFTKHGTGRFGCKKSETDCGRCHPILCKNSLKHRKCVNHQCTLYHLKGTIRKEPVSQPFPPNARHSQSQVFHNSSFQPTNNAWHSKQKQSHHESVPKSPLEENSFLGHHPMSQVSPLATLQAQVNRLEVLITSLFAQGKQPVQASPLLFQQESRFPGIHLQK